MLNLPLQLGPYRLERPLDPGGRGDRYLAYDQRLERRVVVKRILSATESRRRLELLRREARTAAQLSHPSIVQVFDLIENEDSDWVVMEWVEGTPLASQLSHGPLTVDLTLKYAWQIAEGLAAAHHLGIAHRDLKSENVMVLADDRVKILDFGLAKSIDDPQVGPSSDLFSLGVLLYEALTGVLPFRAKSFADIQQRVVTHQPEPVTKMASGVPPALAELVDRLLCKTPELRPTSARGVAGEIAQLMEERRLQALASLAEGSLGDGAIDGTATVTATAFRDFEFLESADALRADSASVGSHVGRFEPRGAVLILFFAAFLLALAVYLSRSERPETGPAAAKKIVEQTSDDPRRLFEDGMRAVRRIEQAANVDRAIDIFSRLIERDGDSAEAHAGLARAYWEKFRVGGDPVFLEQASSMAQEAVHLDADLADARVSLGLLRLSQGRDQEAREELDRALELNPTQADAHYGLAKLAETLGLPVEAEARYHRAIELQPEPLYHDALGSLVYQSGRYEEAEEAFLASLSLAPDNVHALRNLGVLYYSQGRMDEAADKFQSALKIGPDASLYSNLGTIFFSRGHYSKAVAAFEDALRMEGASYHYVFWINLADAYRQVRGREEEARVSYRRAIQLLDKTIEAAPNDVRARSRRALALARAGELTEARGDMDQIRQLGTGDDLYSRFRLAVAEELCGEREKALSSLADALRAGLSPSEVQGEPDLLQLRGDSRFHHLSVTRDEAQLPPREAEGKDP